MTAKKSKLTQKLTKKQMQEKAMVNLLFSSGANLGMSKKLQELANAFNLTGNRVVGASLTDSANVAADLSTLTNHTIEYLTALMNKTRRRP